MSGNGGLTVTRGDIGAFLSASDSVICAWERVVQCRTIAVAVKERCIWLSRIALEHRM